MATSLAAQLRRLEAPQTSQLIDRKIRASIIFDPKEAANKDRRTIFELGLNGLTELAKLNPLFLQFEQTLFNSATIDVERSVESSELNQLLNKAIKKFFYHLSPYFMLQPAHMCLEWLIRRFHIHEFNKEEFIALILPYHETHIFVRCIQILQLRNDKEKWYWLAALQKPGIPLSKLILFNYAARNAHFLKFVSKTTREAVKELDRSANKGHTLQAQINFYCTTVIAALEYSKTISEDQLTAILETILKGLDSKVLDFTAASLMIVAQLLTKTKLNVDLLNVLIDKICKIQHTKMQTDSILLLILMYKTQQENLKDFPANTLEAFIANKWLNSALQLSSQKTAISSLCIPLIGSALRRVQTKDENWPICKTFLDNLLVDIHFIEEDAKNVIRCVLDNYYKKEKPKFVENEIIDIDESDDDNDDPMFLEQDVQMWYAEYLQKLERQYPNEFDFTIKETMQGLENISEARKLALKTVLAFRLKSSYSEDNSTIYENLYHHDARYRQEAVKYLTKHFSQLTVTDQGKLMVKDSLLDRLNDDNAKVLHETLKLNTENIVQLLGAEKFSEKLIEILTKSHIYEQKEWSKVVAVGFKHLIKPSLVNVQAEKTILAFLPFLLPVGTLHITEILTRNELASIPFIKNSLTSAKNNKIEDYDEILKASLNLPKFENILLVFENTTKLFNVGYFLMLSSASLKNSNEKLSPEIGLKALRILEVFKKKSFDIERDHYIDLIKQNKIPIDFYLNFLIQVSKCIQIEANEVNQCAASRNFVNRIYEELTMKSFTVQEKSLKQKYTDKLKEFLNIIFPQPSDKLNFLSNFFMIKNLKKDDFEDLFSLQIRSIKLFNMVIIGKQDFVLDKAVFYKILLGLCSKTKYIRELSLEALKNLCGESDRIYDHFKIFIRNVLKREDEIKMDAEQFPLIICICIDLNRVSMKSESKMEINAADKILTDLLESVENIDGYLKIETLKMLKHINNWSILENLIKYGMKIFDNTSKEILDEIDGKMYSLILQRFDENTTAELLKKSKIGWEFIEKTLKQYNTFIRVNDKIQALATSLLNHFDENIYKAIPQKLKPEFIQLLLTACTYSADVGIHKVAAKLIKRIPMQANLVEKIIKEMISTEEVGGIKKQDNFDTPSPDNLNSIAWKCGVTLLEFLQNKAEITNVKSLIGYLFDVLKICLDFAEQTAIEYTKQLVLSCILNFCQMQKKFTISEKVFRINLIVECIRCTHNPQTHHHALVLLSHCALWIPQQVLDNMIHIFTFMGSSVVRHDDVFSLQLISNVIDSIIPALIKASDGKSENEQQEMVLPVLRVFSDILLDVPEHRRMPLYSKLMRTLGPEKHLWLFLSVVFENHVVADEKENPKKKSREDYKLSAHLPKRLIIALQLIKEFDPAIILETCIQLLVYLKTLPMEKDEKMEVDEVINVDKTIFAVGVHSAKQLRHFKYVILQYISLVSSSTEFVNAIALLASEESKYLKTYYQSFIIKILSYIPKVTEAIEKNEDARLKYWKVLLNHCYSILDNVISLLSADLFLLVVLGLMKHQLAAVRKKVIDLLISKLQYNVDFFENCNENNLLNILTPLNDVLNSILTGEKLMENASINDTHMIQQLTLIAIKLLSRRLAMKHIPEFKEILNKLTKIISKKSNEISKIILAAVVLAITEVSSNLRAHSISVLPKFMPHLLQILRYQEDELKNHAPDNCTVAIVTSIQKIFETLPLFLGPYIEDVFTSLIIIRVNSLPYLEQDQRANAIITRLQQLWTKISTTVPLRILIPNCSKIYSRLIDQKHYSGLKYLMKILTECFDHISAQDIVSQQNEVTAFFLKSLEFRSNISDYGNLDEINLIEEELLQAFVALILKLSESSFRPLYHKVYDWAIRTGEVKDRAITFFLLSRKLSDALKSLFVLFASDFIQDAADLLNKCNTLKTEQLYFDENDKNLILIENILDTLRNIFLHDSKGFVNAHRFDILMQPIVDQLENTLIFAENENLQTILSNCISQLAIASSNDSLWKQLNYQVLLKTRTNNFQVRILSFNCCVEICRKLGDDFSSLLPETIPFVAELLEDENQSVEKNTRKGVQEMEKVLGESLQSYF